MPIGICWMRFRRGIDTKVMNNNYQLYYVIHVMNGTINSEPLNFFII